MAPANDEEINPFIIVSDGEHVVERWTVVQAKELLHWKCELRRVTGAIGIDMGRGARLHLEANDFFAVILECEYIGTQIDFWNGGVAAQPQQFRHHRELGGSSGESIVGASLPGLFRHFRSRYQPGLRLL
jgi:hypothetical protein